MFPLKKSEIFPVIRVCGKGLWMKQNRKKGNVRGENGGAAKKAKVVPATLRLRHYSLA